MNRTPRLLVVANLLLAPLAGCAPELQSNPVDAGADTVATDAATPPGVVRVDATRSDAWVYFDLERGAVLTPADPATDREWDIAFRRYSIMSNGGVSGGAGVEVARVTGVAYDELREAPSGPWLRDVADGPDENTEADYAFNAGDNWYSYNPSSHTLAPRDAVYVVRTGQGGYFRVQVVGYYDSAGTSGHVSFRFASVAAPTVPPPADQFTVAATDANAWVYVNLAQRAAVTVTDPARSNTWDLALRRTQVQTNGGTSGAALGGARLAPMGAAYEGVAQAPTVGFEADAMLPIPGPPGSGEFSGNAALNDWFDYDTATHAVTPRDRVYLVRRADGSYARLRIVAWSSGTFTLRAAPVERLVSVETTSVDASDSAQWVYFSFRAGSVVTPATPGTDGRWDLALRRTQVQTNGGTSGAGRGGALEASSPTLAGITTAPGNGYVADTMLPLPGPPGSGQYSGNATLNTWFNYDMATHVVSPRATAFVVRTADGGFAKVRIASYADGRFGLEWAYAGAGQVGF